MTEYIILAIAFVFSASCGFIFIPVILNFCMRKGLYDKPGARKMHKKPIPRLGGISFLPSMFLSLLCTLALYDYTSESQQLSISLWSAYFAISLILIYGVGFLDDLVGLDATTKFTAQILASLLLPFSGLYINNLYGFLGFHEIPFFMGAPLTVFIMVFVTNAINLIDGIDGLSTGLSLIALLGFLICFMRENMLMYCVLIAALMGVLVAFLYYNIWGKESQNRKIFMGDSGSLSLGFILGFLLVKFMMDNPNVKPFSKDSMMLSCSMLIVPVFDVVRVSFVRIRHHAPIFKADKNHIHHKLMRLGLTQHQTLLTILGLAVLFICMNLLLWQFCYMSILICVDIVVWLLWDFFLNRAIARHGQPVYLEAQK